MTTTELYGSLRNSSIRLFRHRSMMAASMLSSSSVRRFWNDRNDIIIAPQDSYAQLLRREAILAGAFIQAVQSRMQEQQRGDPLDHPPQMSGFLDGKRNAWPAASVTVAEPLFNYGIATEIVAPDALRHMTEENGVVYVQVPGSLAPFIVIRLAVRDRPGTPAALRSSEERVLNRQIGLAYIAATHFTGDSQVFGFVAQQGLECFRRVGSRIEQQAERVSRSY